MIYGWLKHEMMLMADVIEGVKFVDGEKQEVEKLDNEDRMSA